MQIWIDADACPVVVKEIVFRAAERLQIETILVANRMLRTPPSRFIRAIQVPSGFDVADAHIVDQLKAGDLVITADIPLASNVLARQAHALINAATADASSMAATIHHAKRFNSP